MKNPKLLAIKIRLYLKLLSNPEKYKLSQARRADYLEQLIKLLPVDRVEINGVIYGAKEGTIWKQEEIMKYRNILLEEF